VFGLDLAVELLPLHIHVLSIGFVLLHCELLSLLRTHLQGFVEGQRVDFLKDGLEGDQGFL
jgi:hypothetical protein